MAFLGDLKGSTPQLNRYPEGPGIKRLFHSEREIALIIDKTIRKGFGYLHAGTVLAKDEDEFCVPYVPVSVTAGTLTAIGTVYVLSRSGATVNIPRGEAGTFAVGDTFVKVGDEYETEITITAVTPGENFDTITVDDYDDIATGDFLMPKGANTAVYILDQDVDTGNDKDAMGAQASVVLSNATMYKNSLINLDATAIEDLGGIVDGQFYILK